MSAYDPHDDPYDPDDDPGSSYCDGGCGTDIEEVDGNSFEIEPGNVLQLCGDCEGAYRAQLEAEANR